MNKLLLSSLLLALLSYICASGQTPVPALTPPMGWNSWDSYGLTIDEQQFRANASILADKLAPLGWSYAVIDEGWYFRNPEDRPNPELLQYQIDGFGRFIPVPERFPTSAATSTVVRRDGQSFISGDSHGFQDLGRWLHARGLKFGIHIIRGIPKESVRLNLPIADSTFTAAEAADQGDACPWDPTSWGVRDNAAGQAWYNSLLRQYAAWGVDFLKVDCIADHPYRGSEIRQIRRAIEQAGQPMVLSLSPGPMALERLKEITQLAQMWRISNDVWDTWAGRQSFPVSVSSQFQRLAEWAAYAGPGHWPDADMLALGDLTPRPDVGPGPRRSRLSAIEQRTQMTLWAISRSPLIYGGNLIVLDDSTLALLTNSEVIRVNQTSLASRQIAHEGDLVIWSADMPDKTKALALFNLGEENLFPSLTADALGISHFKTAHDLWTGGDQAAQKIELNLPPHGSAMFLVK